MKYLKFQYHSRRLNHPWLQRCMLLWHMEWVLRDTSCSHLRQVFLWQAFLTSLFFLTSVASVKRFCIGYTVSSVYIWREDLIYLISLIIPPDIKIYIASEKWIIGVHNFCYIYYTFFFWLNFIYFTWDLYKLHRFHLSN